MIDSSIKRNIISRLKNDFGLKNATIRYVCKSGNTISMKIDNRFFSLKQSIRSTNIILEDGCLMELGDLAQYSKLVNLDLKAIQDILKISSCFKTCYSIIGIAGYQGIFNFIKVYIPFDNTQKIHYFIDHEINSIGMYCITDIPEIQQDLVRFKESVIPKSYRHFIKGDCHSIIEKIESIFMDIYREQADNPTFIEQEFLVKKMLYL